MENRVDTPQHVREDVSKPKDVFEVVEEERVFAENLSNVKEENVFLASSSEKGLYFHSDYSFLDSDEEVESTKEIS